MRIPAAWGESFAMPRGIVPVVALLIIASAFSQFGGPGMPDTLIASLQPQSGSSAPPPRAEKTGKNLSKTTTDFCKDLTPCLPRADLGPWTASCDFVRTRQETPQ